MYKECRSLAGKGMTDEQRVGSDKASISYKGHQNH